MKTYICAISFWIFISFLGNAQALVSVDLFKSSYILITGSTNIVPFRLIQKGDDLPKMNYTLQAKQESNRIYVLNSQVTIPVKKFTSENKMALRDFLRLVKSDDFPDLYIRLNYLEALGSDKDDFSKANASVNITITGVSRKFNIPVCTQRTGDSYSLDGQERISIREFGLVPPVELMGLIRVSEWITIRFHFAGKMRVNLSR